MHAKLLALLESTTVRDADRAIEAIRLANRLLAQHDMTWADVITPEHVDVTAGEPSEKPSYDYGEMLACVQRTVGPAAAPFIRSLASYYKTRGSLTEKQQRALLKFYRKARE